MEHGSTAILWDVENVNTRSLKGLVDVVEEYAGKFGRLSVAYAFGDWTRRALKGADEILARSSFQLVHIPKGRKNSADISMVTSGMEPACERTASRTASRNSTPSPKRSSRRL